MMKNPKKSIFNFSGLPGKIRKQFSRKTKKTEPVASAPSGGGKRVLMFGWELPPHNSGGLGVACHDMAEAIAKQNVGVTFVLPKKQDIPSDFMKVTFAEDFDDNFKEFLNRRDELIKIMAENGLDVNLINSAYLSNKKFIELIKLYGKALPKSSIWQRFAWLFGHPLYGSDMISEVFRYGEAASKVAKKETFDVIHAHDWLAYPAGVRAKQVSKKPLVVHVHALEYDRSQENSVDHRICEVERMGMQKADKVIAISHYVKNRIMKYYGIPENKIEVVHNGITIKEKPTKKVTIPMIKKGGKKMVLFVGRITYQKGVDYLIAAAAKAIKINPNIIFMIVGSGDMYHQIIRQAADMGISDKIFFPGFLRGEELKNIYKAADLFVMPSVSEPFGLVVLEAMAYKVPVILSHQSGAAEVINHGLKVDFWDVDELANKIVAVLNYKSLQQSLSVHGYEDAVNASWDKAAIKCLSIYRSLVTV